MVVDLQSLAPNVPAVCVVWLADIARTVIAGIWMLYGVFDCMCCFDIFSFISQWYKVCCLVW